MSEFVGVKTVLVVLSSIAQAFDTHGLRNLITHAYPGAVVFFVSVSGDAVGVEAPSEVDLVIDFTPAGARQSMFFAAGMKKRGKYTVGRNAGWFFRRKNFDRVFDDQVGEGPRDYLEREWWAQRKVLELAAVPVIRQGGVGQDRSKDIALELPPLQSR